MKVTYKITIETKNCALSPKEYDEEQLKTFMHNVKCVLEREGVIGEIVLKRIDRWPNELIERSILGVEHAK